MAEKVKKGSRKSALVCRWCDGPLPDVHLPPVFCSQACCDAAEEEPKETWLQQHICGLYFGCSLDELPAKLEELLEQDHPLFEALRPKPAPESESERPASHERAHAELERRVTYLERSLRAQGELIGKLKKRMRK